MKFNIPNQKFAEVHQKAALLWSLCYKEGDTYTGQHGWWKCKDFLNDVVLYLRTGKTFGIYGFNNVATLNEDGGYLALKNTPGFFEHNIALLNTTLIKRGFTPLEILEGDKDITQVVLVPTEFWQNTFYISLITSFIRACVFAKCSSFEECMEYEETLENFSESALKLFTKENQEFCNNLIFANYQYSSQNPPSATYIYHDAGLQSWLNSPKVKEIL